MNNFKIKRLFDSGYSFTSDPKYDNLYKPEYIAKGGDYIRVKQGDTLRWDKDLEIVVLSPPQEYLTEDTSSFSDPIGHHNPNLNSIVLRMKYKKMYFFLLEILSRWDKII